MPQLIPDGLDVTAPAPIPVLATARLNRCSMKIAVTDRALLIATVQVAPETESQPVHPVKIESTPAAAVNVTCESLTNDAVHVWPHAMPAGLEVTVPRPSP